MTPEKAPDVRFAQGPVSTPIECEMFYNKHSRNLRVHDKRSDTVIEVSRKDSLGQEFPARLIFSLPLLEPMNTLVGPIAEIGVPQTVNYEVRQTALTVWRPRSVYRCEFCGERVEVGSYLHVTWWQLEKEGQ